MAFMGHLKRYFKKYCENENGRPAWVLPVPCGRLGGGAWVARSVALCGSLCGVRWFGGVSDKRVTVAAFCGRFCGSQTMRKYKPLRQRQKGKRKAARVGAAAFCLCAILF